MVDKQKIDELLTRGVGEFIDPDGIFRKKLETDPKKIVIKFGVDPNRPDIHLGHAVILHKLRQFQELGCKVIFLIGDYTAQIGDPTGKNKTRLEIEQKEIERNMKTYLNQISILKQEGDVFSWIRNSDWFTSVTDIMPSPGVKINFSKGNQMIGVFNANSFIGKALLFEKTRMQVSHIKNNVIHTVSLNFLLNTLRKVSHNRLLERDMFRDRLKRGEELHMHEMLYPVLQGIDSHILAKIYGSCDLEVGGTDQHFNMLMGRQVMGIHDQVPQAVLTFKLLEGTDGEEKMSKSLDNYIGITDEPNDMYGKIMSIPDSSIVNYFELCTFTPETEIADIRNELAGASVNPKDIKMKLARQIVEIYHGSESAAKAEDFFVGTFQKKEIPEKMEEISAKIGELLSEVLVKNKVLSSKGEWRRLVLGNGAHDLDKNTAITDQNIRITENLTLKIGKKRFIRIVRD
jgi:tyrosyl-tRNA synthetase